MSFKVGDKVEWRSQANGGWKAKSGVVCEVLAAGRLSHIAGCVCPRDHESYVVKVQIGKRLKRDKYYWPRVSALKLASEPGQVSGGL